MIKREIRLEAQTSELAKIDDLKNDKENNCNDSSCNCERCKVRKERRNKNNDTSLENKEYRQDESLENEFKH